MLIRNHGSTNYLPRLQDLVDPEQLLIQELGNTPGLNLQQPNNPYAEPRGGSLPSTDSSGTTSQPSRSGTDINEILRSSPQGAEFLLGLGGSGRNNAYALAANRADRRITSNRQRVQDLIKLDPTNPLAALVAMLGAREEHLLNEDLVGVRNAYGKQERADARNKKFKEYLTQSGFGNAFKRLMAMSVEEGGFGGDLNLAIATLSKDKSALVAEHNKPYPVSEEKYSKMSEAWFKVSEMKNNVGTGFYTDDEEDIINETYSYLSAWFDNQNQLRKGQKISDGEFDKQTSNLTKVSKLHASSRKKLQQHERNLISGKDKLTSVEQNSYKLELNQLRELEKQQYKLSPEQIKRKALVEHILKLNGGSAIEKIDPFKKPKPDEGLERIQAKNAQKELYRKWGYQGIETSFGFELPADSPEWLNWSFDKQAEQINKVIDYWREKEKYSIQTGEKIPDWVSGLMKDKYPFTGEMLNAYLSKVDPAKPGVDDQIIANAREALNFEIPGVTEAQVSDDSSQVDDTSVTRPTPEFYNTQDQGKFGDKKDESTNPYMKGVDTKGTPYIESLDVNTWLTPEGLGDSGDGERYRTNKYISPDALDNTSVTDPNASTVLKEAMDMLDNVEKDVAKKAKKIKDYGEKSLDVVTGKIKEGAGKITKGVESGVRKGREGWDFIKRETIKRKNELYKKLRDLNKEMESSRKLFGMTLPDPVKIDETRDSKWAGEGRPLTEEEANRSMEFGWNRYKDNEYTRTVKYLAPDASPLTKKEQTRLEKLEEKFNEVLNEFKDFIYAPINSFGLPDFSFKFSREGLLGESSKWAGNNMIEEAPGEKRMGGMGGPDKSGSPGMSALDSSFQFDPNSDLSYDDQLTAHQYEKDQWPTDLAEFEQKEANSAAIKAILNRPDQRVHPSQDSPAPDFKKFELEKAVYDLNNPNTSDERLLSIYENELQGYPEAQEHFERRFPNLINSSVKAGIDKGRDNIFGIRNTPDEIAAFAKKFIRANPDNSEAEFEKVIKEVGESDLADSILDYIRGRGKDNSNFIANLDEDTKFILQTENASMDERAVGHRLKPKMKDGKKVTKNGKVVMEYRLRDGEKIPVSYGLMQLTPKTAYATDYWKKLVKKEKPANEEEKIELLFNPKHSVAISKEFRKKLEDKIRGAVAKKNLAWTEKDIRMAVVTAYNWNGENFGSVIRRAGMDDFKSTLSKWDTIHKKNKENQVPDETWSQIRRYKTLRGWK